MKNRRNHYRVLHVQPDAPKEIICSSYRTMMQRMRMHPDLGGDDRNAAIINEAYATLANSRSRVAYDKTRLYLERGGSTSTVTGGTAARPSSKHSDHCTFCGTRHEYGKNDQIGSFCGNCQSPLFLAEQSLAEKRDRRTIARVSNKQSLIFCTHWPQSEPCAGQADDISLNGMKFHSNTSLQEGQIIKIESQVLRSVARVTHCQQQRNGYWKTGVQFVSLCFIQSRGSFISGRA